MQIKNLDESYNKNATDIPRRSIQVNEAAKKQAIALVLQEQAEWLLNDDAKARQFAEALDLEVHGSIVYCF